MPSLASVHFPKTTRLYLLLNRYAYELIGLISTARY